MSLRIASLIRGVNKTAYRMRGGQLYYYFVFAFGQIIGGITVSVKHEICPLIGRAGHLVIDCWQVETAAGRDAGFVRNLGADEVIDFNTERFEERAKEIDFVLDTVGGENFVRSLHVLRPDGMIVLLPSDRKAEADEAAVAYGVGNYRHILMHSSGEGMRRIADLLAGGRLRVHVDSVFPFGEIARAHERLEGGGVRGKVVVAME